MLKSVVNRTRRSRKPLRRTGRPMRRMYEYTDSYYAKYVTTYYDLGRVYAKAFPDEEFVRNFRGDYDALGEQLCTTGDSLGDFGPKSKPGFTFTDNGGWTQSEWNTLIKAAKSYNG